MANVSEVKESDCRVASEKSPEKTNENTSTKPTTPPLSVASSRVPALDSADEEDNDEDLDESIFERLMGLTEMLPESLRNACHSYCPFSIKFAKGAYKFSRNLAWYVSSTAMLLLVPVMIEMERVQAEDSLKLQQKRVLLGPSSATSGHPDSSSFMAPPPTR